jgi:hypothetical protein
VWDSEEKVLRSLSQLPATWRVFHSVAWQGDRDGRQADGEADFVLLHPQHGLMIVEVKGGGIEVVNGQWFSTNRKGRYRIKNPFVQAKASKYALVKMLQRLGSDLPRTPVIHAVAFPDGSMLGGIGLEGPRDIILDRGDLTQPEDAVMRVVAHWQARINRALSAEEQARIIAELAPSAVVMPLLRDALAESNQELIRLTQQQLQVLSLSRHLHRAVVLGGAGTGKTILAKERALRLAHSGRSTLLLCYNAPLAEHLRLSIGNVKGLTVVTFHAFCMDVMRQTHAHPPREPSSEWWETAAAQALAQATASATCPQYQAIVLDEAQDFAPDWLDALLLFLQEPDEDPVYIFGDHHQELYPRAFAFPEGWPRLQLELNCRNTIPIAEKVSRLFGDPLDAMGAEGRAPIFQMARDEPEQLRVVQRAVARMIAEEGLAASQIVVLCDRRQSVDWFRERMAGDVPFGSLGGAGVVAETVYRYKGLEADAVVLLLTNAHQKDAKELKCLAYVGMSRARGMLLVVASQAVRALLDWPT